MQVVNIILNLLSVQQWEEMSLQFAGLYQLPLDICKGDAASCACGVIFKKLL